MVAIDEAAVGAGGALGVLAEEPGDLPLNREAAGVGFALASARGTFPEVVAGVRCGQPSVLPPVSGSDRASPSRPSDRAGIEE
jgi:hypothetical protein